ncbi:MAG: TetR/AcrR family transcriptional regulator [Bacteroidota bacterium]|nr:TetR/AcrR family transcriptional regulator [Bacteroidota bacterium]
MSYSKDDEVKKAILDAALRVFRKWGLNKTTMEDVAREAGKGKSTLYYYYKSKEEIFYAVIILEMQLILEKVKKSIEGIVPGKEKLRQYIVSSLTEIKNATSIYSIVHDEMRGNRNLVDKLNEVFNSLEADFIKDILHQGVANNEFCFADEKELDLAAKVIIGIIHSMELYLFMENTDIEQIDMAAKLIANGI